MTELRSPEMTPAAGRLLTGRDVAALLQVRPSFVYALARRNEIPTVRLGARYVRFDRGAIDRWIAEQGTVEPR